MGKILSITIIDGVYHGGWLHEVSVDKDGNVEDSYCHYYLCKDGEKEVEKEDKLPGQVQGELCHNMGVIYKGVTRTKQGKEL